MNLDNQCISAASTGWKKGQYNALKAGSWLANFRSSVAGGQDGEAYMANAFTIAAYLANMAWISNGDVVDSSLTEL